MNKWRYGEVKEALEKELKTSQMSIEAYKLETERIKERLTEQNKDQDEVAVELYKTRLLTYVSMLEKHVDIKDRLNAVTKSIIGLTYEKIEILERMCELAPQQPPASSLGLNPVAPTPPVSFPVPSVPAYLHSGIGLRYKPE